MPNDLSSSRFGGGSRVIHLKVVMDGSGAARAMNDMKAGMFKWRDSVNPVVNAFAKVFRELARIRTAFFILVTFLGLRRVYAFFKDLTDQSQAMRSALEGTTNWFTQFGIDLSRKLAPTFKLLGEAAIAAVKDIVATIDDNPTILTGIVDFIDKLVLIAGIGIKQMIPAVADVASGLMTIAKSLLDGIGALIIAAMYGWSDYVLPFIASIKKQVASVFWDIKLYIAQLRGAATSELDKIQADFDLRRSEINQDMIMAQSDMSERVRNMPAAWKRTYYFPENFTEGMGSGMSAMADGILKALDSINALIHGLSGPRSALAGKVLAELRVKFHELRMELEGGDSGRGGWINDQVYQSLTQFAEGFASSVKSIQESANDLGKALHTAFQGGLSDAIVAAWNFKWKSMRDIAVNTLKDIQKAMADFLAKSLIKGLLENILAPMGNALGGALFPTSRVPTLPVPAAPPWSDYGKSINNVNLSIHTPDTKSMTSYLMNNRETIVSIVSDGMAGGSAAMRRTARGV